MAIGILDVKPPYGDSVSVCPLSIVDSCNANTMYYLARSVSVHFDVQKQQSKIPYNPKNHVIWFTFPRM